MRRGHEELFDKVLFVRLHRHFAFAPTALTLVEANRLALNIPAITLGHDHVFFDNQILDVNLFLGLNDLGAPGITSIDCRWFLRGRVRR